VREMPSENEVWKHTMLRSSKYLNNPIEQGSSRDQVQNRPMLGFKRFDERPSPLPESNYYVVFTKADSPSDLYASKTKPRSIWNAVLAP
jgi:transposase-like protein